ncbi:transposase [Paraburkholderia sp. RL17-337-BIB-A]|uniref:transposase n=1 Tax=Paraburkholderia sp. RL17-337-BIB-A TaxID=3031636 RepID=UPI0038BB71FC
MDTVAELTETRAVRKYCRRATGEKRGIVEETLSCGRSVAEIARAHEVNANPVFDWRRQYHVGRLGSAVHDCTLLPVIVHDPEDSAVDATGAARRANLEKDDAQADPNTLSEKADATGRMSRQDAQSLRRGGGDGMYTRKANATREVPWRGQE